MFYCYVLLSRKTGRRHVRSCENLSEQIRRLNADDSKATKHGKLGWRFTVKALTLLPVRRNASAIMRPDEAGMSWTDGRTAVAAATRRRFKSSRPRRSFPPQEIRVR